MGGGGLLEAKGNTVRGKGMKVGKKKGRTEKKEER
jgi:hypothetical protein